MLIKHVTGQYIEMDLLLVHIKYIRYMQHIIRLVHGNTRCSYSMLRLVHGNDIVVNTYEMLVCLQDVTVVAWKLQLIVSVLYFVSSLFC